MEWRKEGISVVRFELQFSLWIYLSAKKATAVNILITLISKYYHVQMNHSFWDWNKENTQWVQNIMSPAPNKEMLKTDGHITKVQKGKLTVYIPGPRWKNCSRRRLIWVSEKFRTSHYTIWLTVWKEEGQTWGNDLETVLKIVQGCEAALYQRSNLRERQEGNAYHLWWEK